LGGGRPPFRDVHLGIPELERLSHLGFQKKLELPFGIQFRKGEFQKKFD